MEDQARHFQFQSHTSGKKNQASMYLSHRRSELTPSANSPTFGRNLFWINNSWKSTGGFADFPWQREARNTRCFVSLISVSSFANVKGTVAVTFDDFCSVFALCMYFSFLFNFLKHVEMPSVQLVNAVCACVKYIVIVDIWILVRTKIHLSTLTVFIIHIQAAFNSRNCVYLNKYR